jgi:hypothetical protein
MMNIALGDKEDWPHNRGTSVLCINCNMAYVYHYNWACQGSGINSNKYPILVFDCYYSKLPANKRYLTADMQAAATQQKLLAPIKHSVVCPSCKRKLILDPKQIIAFNSTGKCGTCRIGSGQYTECAICNLIAIPKGYKDCLVCKQPSVVAKAISKIVSPTSNEWKLWRDSGRKPGECACGIFATDCKYHNGA